jgi:DNA-binding GntR family transcriptional regulator
MALEVLRASGLVAVRRDRSIEVVGVTAEALRDLVALRFLVEREALLLAVARRVRRDVTEAAHLQARLECETKPDLLEEMDCAFHSALYKPCGNARLLKLIEELRREDRRPYSEQQAGSAKRSKWCKQHRKLLELYADGESDRAVVALEEHLAELTRR